MTIAFTRWNALSLVACLIAAVSCAPAPDAPMSDSEMYWDQVDELLDDPCGAADDAVYHKVEDSWNLRPCGDCPTRDIELTFGGNTGQHLDMEAELDEIAEELSLDEVPVRLYEERTGSCP